MSDSKHAFPGSGYDASRWDLGVSSHAEESLSDPTYSHQLAIYVGNLATLRIVQAAPELLAALEDLAVAVNAAGVPFGTRIPFEQARAAIARARGEG